MRSGQGYLGLLSQHNTGETVDQIVERILGLDGNAAFSEIPRLAALRHTVRATKEDENAYNFR